MIETLFLIVLTAMWFWIVRHGLAQRPIGPVDLASFILGALLVATAGLVAFRTRVWGNTIGAFFAPREPSLQAGPAPVMVLWNAIGALSRIVVVVATTSIAIWGAVLP